MGDSKPRQKRKPGPKVKAIAIGDSSPSLSKNLPEPENVLFRIQRGLAGYVSYLAACEMNEAFSEYILYEPMLRILTAQDYHVRCEVKADGVQHADTGDKQKLDFVAVGHNLTVAIEAKWTETSTLTVDNDVRKLKAFHDFAPDRRAFLVAFGRWSVLNDLQIKDFRDSKLAKVMVSEILKPVFALFFLTKYGCRVFEIK